MSSRETRLAALSLALVLCVPAISFLSPPPASTADASSDGERLARALQSISGSRMLSDATLLSSPEYNGRQTGTADDLHSALLVADRFRSLGLRPAGTEPLIPHSPAWAMTTPVVATRLGTPTMEVSSAADVMLPRVETDYLPILDSPSVNVTAPVVFVGYGISDPARGFDEYQGVEVRGRIVLFLRGKPERYSAPATHAEKERVAREKGAIAFLTATGPVLSAYELRRGVSPAPQASYGDVGGERPLPGCWISTALAERILAPYLASRGRSLRPIQEELNTLSPRSGPVSVLVRLAWESFQAPGTLFNIAGLLPGREPSAGAAGTWTETVVVGAHRDHFGRQAGLLFSGADDNASGTAILLEVARVIAESGGPLTRTILFVSFSGEEQGLRGSRLYVSRPLRPLSGTVGMVNVDHAGVGNGRLTVGITSLPKAVAADAGQATGLADRLDLFGFFPGGDHVPFKEAGVPTVTVVSGGGHPDFHQPGDTAEKIQPAILEAVARYVLAVTWKLANAE